MADALTAGDLPEFLDPLLSYLADNLPPPAYSVLVSVLSHGLALISALFTLTRSMLSDSSNWNAQTLLPPIIALLSAYLALVSLYRTTTWMVRTSFWFIKWGTLLAGLAGGAGWVMGNNGNALGGHGVVNTLGGLILDMINGEGKNAAGRSRSSRSSGRKRSNQRPKPWDSFQAHRDWQYQEQEPTQDSAKEAQAVIENILSAAGSTLKESSWWSVLKGVAGGDSEESKEKSTSGSVSR